MHFTAVTRTCVVLGLICFCHPCLRHAIADESTSAVLGQSELRTGRINELEHFTWAILDAIEREHVEAPSRLHLIQIVAPVLIGIKEDGLALGDAVKQLAGNQNADAFIEVLCHHRLNRSWPVTPIDQVMAVLSPEYPDLRLIPATEHVVQEQLLGNRYVGLGVSLSDDKETQTMQFMTVVPGGPADRSGLKAGTLIHEIDGRSTRGVPIEKVVDWIRGPAGTEITLLISDPQSTDKRTVTLNRGVVRFDSVVNKGDIPLSRGTIRDSGIEPIGWIKIKDITGSTLHELRVADGLARAKGIRVLVVDLRSPSRSDNLHQVRLVTDSLLDGGALWHRSERGTEPFAEEADRECLFRGMPLVLLVNQHSGPGQTTIAAALQDAGRAKIVGNSPGFNGTFGSTISLSGVPYFLAMNTTNLKRARRDAHWPLEPDFPIADPNERERTRIDSVLSKRDSGAQVRATSETPVSALYPANRPLRYFITQKIPESINATRRQIIADFQRSCLFFETGAA